MQVLFFLAGGIIAGYFLRARKNVLATAGAATTWSLYVLIFLLGISVGTNDAVVRALGRLGLQALVLSAGGIVGSVLVGCVVFRMFFDLGCHEK